MATISSVDGLDLSAIRIFLAAVELGSVSKAAGRMQIAQPSATAKIQKLERQLGTVLLERTATGSVATAAGAGLVAACEELLATASVLLDRATSVAEQGDRLTIAVTRHVADHFLPVWLAGASMAGVRLDLIELDTLGVAQSVRAGESTLGFTEGPRPPLGLRSHIAASERVVPVVGRSHRWFGRSGPVAMTDLRGDRVILPRAGSGTRDVVEAAFDQHEWAGTGEYVDVDHVSGARLAAINGDGVAFLPECWARDHVASGSLTVLRIRGLEIEQPVRVIWRGARPATRPARTFVEKIVDRTLERSSR